VTAPWGPGEHAFPGQRLDELLLWAAGEGASEIASRPGDLHPIDGAGRRTRPGRTSSVEVGTCVAGGWRQ